MKFKLLINEGVKASSEPKAKKQVTKNKKSKDTFSYIPFSLHATISEKYEGVADSLGGLINNLSSPIKKLFSNSNLKRTIYNHDGLLCILENGFTIKIKELTYARRHSVRLVIKEKNKVHYDKITDYDTIYKRSK